MKPSIALKQHKVALYELISSYAITDPKVFGSVLYGYDHPFSDLNLFIEPPSGTSLEELAQLHEKIEELLGISVDLVTPKDFSDRERVLVMLEAKPILDF